MDLSTSFILTFFNILVYYLIRRKDSDAPSHVSPTFILLLCCDETKIERKCSLRRFETHRWVLRRRSIVAELFVLPWKDAILLVARRKSNRRTISFFLPSSSALCRVLDWSNRTLVNGRNRFHRRSTTNSPRRELRREKRFRKKTTFRLDSRIQFLP